MSGTSYSTVRTRPARFHCKACGFGALTIVRSTEGRDSTVSVEDQRALDEYASGLPCPKCGNEERAALDRLRRKTALQALGLMLVAFALFHFGAGKDGPWPRVLVPLALGSIWYLGSSWRWKPRDRARFATDEEVKKHRERDASKHLPSRVQPASKLFFAPLWGPGNDGVVSVPFFADLRFGLRTYDDDGENQWIREWDLKGTKDAAIQEAMHDLERVAQDPWSKEPEGAFSLDYEGEIAASVFVAPGLFAGLNVKGYPIVFAPTEDTLYVAGEDDVEALKAAAKAAAVDARRWLEGPNPSGAAFTARPWKLVSGKLEPWNVRPELVKHVKTLEKIVGKNGWRA